MVLCVCSTTLDWRKLCFVTSMPARSLPESPDPPTAQMVSTFDVLIGAIDTALV